MVSIIVPWHSLSADALNGVIEEFVTREGTDYGFHEVSLAEKCAAVQRQIEQGEAVIIFNDEDHTCSISLADKQLSSDAEKGKPVSG